METAIPILLSTAVQHALESTNPIHTPVWLTDLADTALVKSLCSFPCIDEVRALPHAAGFPGLGVLRPAPTAARPPSHFPGSPVIGQASLPATPQATGPRRLSRVPTTTIRTFNAQYAGGFLSARSWNKDAFHGLRRAPNRLGSLLPSPKAGTA